MDESFEISAVDGSFHEEQEVGSQYECNECTYKTCFKQNLKRHIRGAIDKFAELLYY